MAEEVRRARRASATTRATTSGSRRRRSGFLDALLASQPEATFDETFRQARDELHAVRGRRSRSTRRHVQRRAPRRTSARAWAGCDFLREFGFGGCLADDMGLGKTVQVLALLESRRRASSDGTTPAPRPSLVVVPRSLVFNWKQEADAVHARAARARPHRRRPRRRPSSRSTNYDLILTTYGTLRRDIGVLQGRRSSTTSILDEAQAIKNAGSESAKAARLLQGRPPPGADRHAGREPPRRAVEPVRVPQPRHARAASACSTTTGGRRGATPDAEARELLARALRPFILRRTKEQVAKDLPEKLEQTIYCELEPAQRKLYDELRDHYRTVAARHASQARGIEQVEDPGPRSAAAPAAGGVPSRADRQDARRASRSAKLDVLLTTLTEVLDEGHKVLVFSQFTSFLAIVSSGSTSRRSVYEYLDGRTRDRQARVERFQNDPDCKLFLISLKAGGLGLNLTAAEYVFLLDPWWNPAVEAQAIDRAHRIGQTQPGLRLPPDRQGHGRGEGARSSSRARRTWPTRSSTPTTA